MSDSIGTYWEEVINKMLELHTVDLYITEGLPINHRIGDKLIPHDDKVLTSNIIDKIIEHILTPEQKEDFYTNLEYNFTIEWKESSRFRINIFRQQNYSAMVIRQFKNTIPTLEELDLPPIYKQLIMKKKGLIIISSPSGSGKSTSVAAMLDYRNANCQGHIITIEDPIEYIYSHKKSIINQREVGIDTYSYGIALKNALRQRADVIFIGEIRDRDTMEQALNFSETGHLCVSTLHSNNAHQALMRILNLYPEELHKSVKLTLSHNLEAILSQKLVENVRGTKSAAIEIMLNMGLVKNLISEGRFNEIKEVMEKHHDMGMQTFDYALFNMYRLNIITEQVALANAENYNAMKLMFSQLKATTIMEESKKIKFIEDNSKPF